MTNSDIQLNNKKKGVKIYASGGCVVIKNIWNTEKFSTGGSTRSAITGFSARSGQRMRKYLRGCEAEYAYMHTLTYPFSYESNGAVVKDHLKKYMRWLKDQHINSGQELKGRFSAFWFLEFQSRGAPHYHIFTNCLVDYKKVAKKWFEIVGSEDNRHLAAGTRVEALKKGRGGTISYASKYAAKAEQKTPPEDYKNIGRFWGVYGNRVIVEASTVVRACDYEKYASNFRKLKKLLELAKLDKKTVQHVDKIGCEVLFIKNRKLFTDFQREVNIIECKVNHYSMIFADADIED